MDRDPGSTDFAFDRDRKRLECFVEIGAALIGVLVHSLEKKLSESRKRERVFLDGYSVPRELKAFPQVGFSLEQRPLLTLPRGPQRPQANPRKGWIFFPFIGARLAHYLGRQSRSTNIWWARSYTCLLYTSAGRRVRSPRLLVGSTCGSCRKRSRFPRSCWRLSLIHI